MSGPTAVAGLPLVRLFTRANCCLCEPVKFVIHKAQRKYPFRFEEVDIAAKGNEAHLEAYTNDIPVVHLQGCEIARHKLSEAGLIKALQDAGVKHNNS